MWERLAFRPRLNTSSKGDRSSAESLQTPRADCRRELYVP